MTTGPFSPILRRLGRAHRPRIRPCLLFAFVKWKCPLMENLSLSVPDLLQTVKNYVGTDKHEQLDEMLRRYTSKQHGKQQLQFELRVVAGRDALRQALLAMVPQIDELQKNREAMKLQQVRRPSSRSCMCKSACACVRSLVMSQQYCPFPLAHVSRRAKRPRCRTPSRLRLLLRVAAVASHLDESPTSQYMRLCTPSIATMIGARSAPVLRPRVF